MFLDVPARIRETNVGMRFIKTSGTIALKPGESEENQQISRQHFPRAGFPSLVNTLLSDDEILVFVFTMAFYGLLSPSVFQVQAGGCLSFSFLIPPALEIVTEEIHS